MATQPDPVTLSALARLAADLVDPEDENPNVADFEQIFEDADEPVRALLEDPLDQRVEEAMRRVDPEEELPDVVMAAAVMRYLAHRTDSVDEQRADVLRLAARAEFHGDPPPVVSEWLVDQGVAV
jgi:hypothetical protein